MSASDLTTVPYIMKRLYSGGRPASVAQREKVLLSHLRKEPGFTGASYHVAVNYGSPQGVGSTFTTAQSAAASSKGIQWTLTRAKKYGFCTIDAELIYASKNDQGAFVRAVKQEVDWMLDEMGHRLAVNLYGDTGQTIGQRASLSTNTVTLSNADDAKHFSVGMTVGAVNALTGGTPRTGTTTIAAVNEDGGTVTLTSAAAITSFADNDYLFAAGDYDLGLAGLASWFPLTAPTSGDSFFGVDRSVDTGRLSGWRVNDTNSSIEENMITLAAKCQRAGGRPRNGYLNPTNWANLSKRLGSKVQRDQGGEATIGFEYITVATPAGGIKVYSDPECPSNRGYILDLRSLYVKHLEGLPHIVMEDGMDSLRQASADGVEVRGRYWAQLVCDAPGWNGVFAI